MVRKTNVAGSELYAAIGVTYPAGSTVTCTGNGQTWKAKTTTGQWVFPVPKTGTYTITATDGSNTKSESVSITAEGQFASVELNYGVYFYKAGDEYKSVTGGWNTVAENGIATITKGSSYISTNAAESQGYGRIITANKINLSELKTLHFKVDVSSVFNAGGTGYIRFGPENQSASGDSNFASYIEKKDAVTGINTYSVDISSISAASSYYVGLYFWKVSFKLLEVWGE